MKIYDTVKKEDVEISDYRDLIKIMQDGRQVDLYLKEKKSDEDGYMSWDVEHWSSVAPKRFIRCYSLEGAGPRRVHGAQHLRPGERVQTGGGREDRAQLISYITG